MNWKTIKNWALIVSGIGSVIYIFESAKADGRAEKAWKESCKFTADRYALSDDDKKALNDLKDVTEKKEAILDRESDYVTEEVAKWEVLNQYQSTTSEIKEAANNRMLKWDEDHAYSRKLQEYEDEAKAKIDDYISSTGCDNRLKILNDHIKAAEKKYNSEKAVASAVRGMNDNFSEGANAIEKSAKEALDEAVKGYKAEINEIKNAKDAFINGVYKDKTAAVSDLRILRNSYRSQVFADMDKELLPHRNARAEAVKKLKEDVVANRSVNDIATIEAYDALTDKVHGISKKKLDYIEKMDKDMGTLNRKFATAWVSYGGSVPGFIVLASMPVIFVGCLVGGYIAKVVEIVKYMKNITIVR